MRKEVEFFHEQIRELVKARCVLSQTRQECPGIAAVCLGRRFRLIVALKSSNNATSEQKFRGSRRE